MLFKTIFPYNFYYFINEKKKYNFNNMTNLDFFTAFVFDKRDTIN